MHRPAWLPLLRWHMVVMVVIVAVAMGYLGASGHPTSNQWWHILLSTVLLIVVAIGVDFQNWAAEWQDDLLAGKKSERPIPMGDISATTVLTAAVMMWFGCFIVAAWFFPPIYLTALVGVCLSSWVYSGYPTHWKDGLITNSSIAIPRTIAGPICAFTAVGGSIFSTDLWVVIGVTASTVILGGEIRNASPSEISGDLAAGVVTFSNTFGERAGKGITLVGFALAPLFAVLVYPTNLLMWLLWAPLAFFLVAFARGWPTSVTHPGYHVLFSITVAVVVVGLLFPHLL